MDSRVRLEGKAHEVRLGWRSSLGLLAMGALLHGCSAEGKGADQTREPPLGGGPELPPSGGASGLPPSGGVSELPPSGVVSELRSSEARVLPDASEAAAAGKSEHDFGFSFLHALPADENVAFSPHSLSAAFAMLSDAAQGDTLAQLSQVLRFGATGDALHRSQAALGLELARRNAEAVSGASLQVDARVLSEANDIWLRSDAPPDPSFLATLARYYGAGAHQADFGARAEEVRLAINARVAANTHGLIKDLIAPGQVDEATVVVLTNALYFKAPWAKRFSPPVTGTFHGLDGTTVDAPMLNSVTTLPYYAEQGFVGVSVPYYGDELQMLLVVPDAEAYAQVRAALSGDALTRIVAGLRPQLVDLSVPQFEVSSTVPATRALKDLGMSAAFDQGTAELAKLDSPRFPDVYLSDVLHQATVSVDERGTEASAATAVLGVGGGSAGGGQPPQIQVVDIDRPFFFVIRDNPTGSALFIGQVVQP